jgi:LysR family hydrogen peroxide-inducible transcriptional activator
MAAPSSRPVDSVLAGALPSLRQLRYAVAVADHRNFTLAAEACFVAQPSLSAGIKELEDMLGVRLFERDRSRVLPTPIGEQVVERARRLLTEAGDLMALARGASQPMTGVLRLGAIPTIAPFVLSGLVAAMRETAPALRLMLREDTSANLVARLRAGTLDFGVLALPYPLEDLFVEHLYDDPLLLVTRADASPPGNAAIAPEALDADSLILLEEGHCLREHTLVACASGRDHPAGRHSSIEASSLITLVQMVAGGLGMAMLPQMALGSGLIESAGLAVRRLKPPPVRGIALVCRPTSTRSAEFAAIARALKALAKPA